MARKTIAIADVIGKINDMLKNSDDDRKEGRIALAVLAESILFSVNNYKGYGLLASEYLPAGEQTNSSVLRDGHDDTRRRYNI